MADVKEVLSKAGRVVKEIFSKAGQWLGGFVNKAKKDCRKAWSWYGSVSIVPLGRVSRIHMYEARERFRSLKGLVDFNAKLSGLDLPDCDDENYNPYQAAQTIMGSAPNDDEKKRRLAIFSCHEALHKSKGLITRKQKNLNDLWRELTRVRIILIEHVFSDETLPFQLHFCREEAHRLGVTEDPEVKDMLNGLAENTDMSPGSRQGAQFKCYLRALLERFNTIRTSRIHQQYVNIRTYKSAFVFLFVISALVTLGGDMLLPDMFKSSVSLPDFTFKFKAEWHAGVPNLLEALWSLMVYFMVYLYDLFRGLIKDNVLACAFFGGLTGGLISVTTRLRNLKLAPGEDAYFAVYMLTKPFVGAVGAVALYILLMGEFFTPALVKSLDQLKASGIGVFGFAFIAGFSERIVFPTFR